MSVTFKVLSKALPFVCKARMPILVRGRHGIGKSCLAYALGSHLGLPVVERRASQMTEGDLLGLPKLERDRTKWLAPDWLKEACDNPVVLFIDEIDRATTEVRQGFFELCDSRKIAGHALHSDTHIIACVNGGEHGEQYQVGEMDPAELDRYTVFDVDPDVEDWLNWAGRKRDDGQAEILSIIREFIREHHKHLEHEKGVFEPNKVYPSRRSWHRLSLTMEAGGDDLWKPGQFNELLGIVTQGFVGLEAMVEFTNYVENYSKVVTTDDILNKGNVDLTDDFDINAHCALIDKFIDEESFKKELTDKQADNIVAYFITCPSEAAMKLWNAYSDGHISNVVKFHAHESAAKYLLVLTSDEKDA